MGKLDKVKDKFRAFKSYCKVKYMKFKEFLKVAKPELIAYLTYTFLIYFITGFLTGRYGLGNILFSLGVYSIYQLLFEDLKETILINNTTKKVR